MASSLLQEASEIPLGYSYYLPTVLALTTIIKLKQSSQIGVKSLLFPGYICLVALHDTQRTVTYTLLAFLLAIDHYILIIKRQDTIQNTKAGR